MPRTTRIWDHEQETGNDDLAMATVSGPRHAEGTGSYHAVATGTTDIEAIAYLLHHAAAERRQENNRQRQTLGIGNARIEAEIAIIEAAAEALDDAMIE